MTVAAPVRCVCGRLLADPVSRAAGLGPVCRRRLAGRTEPRVSIPRPNPGTEPMDGQTELPLTDHQPTLWSL
ncbi:DUF6011 domain-containing protein [Streptomyces sp. NPDC004539]|uniref:DUF6011 domain-containing protein n=1 Tax=Streptomyces sp. NPDC004539 TaxID=3154280 RepID=UPI0033A6A93E